MGTHVVYFAYIVQCSDGSYYAGKTWNLVQRVRQHNGELKGGAHYTKIRRPVTLKYFEKYLSHNLAARREFELKKLTHKEKELLCLAKR